MLLPSVPQPGAVVVTLGIEGGAVAGELLKEALGADWQLPLSAVSV